MCFLRTAVVLRSKLGNQTKKLALAALADLAHPETGECYPSYEYISRFAECSRRTAIRHVDELEQQGFITIIRRKGTDNKNQTNLYRLNFSGESMSLENKFSGDTGTPPSDPDDKTSGVTGSPNYTTLDQTNNSIKNTKSNQLDFSPLGFTTMQIAEWKGLRKSAKAPINQRAINMVAKEFDKSRLAGFTSDQILDVLSEKGWKGYKHDWLINSVAPTNQNQGRYNNDQASQAPTVNGIAYGEHADQSIFPAHLRIASNDIPALKASRTAIQRSYIEHCGNNVSSQGCEPMEPINPDVWEPLELDEREGAEHRVGELPNFTDGQTS